MNVNGVPSFTIPNNNNNNSINDDKNSTNYVSLGINVIKFDNLLAIFGKYVNHFIYLEDNGSISLSVIDWKSFKFIKTRNFNNTYFTKSVICCSSSNYVIFYDMSVNKMVKFNIDRREFCSIMVPPLIIVHLLSIYY